MGNTIKNYQKKRRRDSRKAVKELNGIVHDAIVEKLGLPKELLEKKKRKFLSGQIERSFVLKKIVMFIIVLLAICQDVSAEELNESIKDDVGRCVSGTIVSFNTIGETCTREVYTSDDSSFICLLRKYNPEKNEYIYYYSGLGSYIWNIDFTTDGSIDGEYVVNIIDSCSCDNYAFGDDGGTILISTNIPIFDADNIDAITAYAQTGDTSGAANQEDLFDESVELPVGLIISGGYADGMESAYSIDEDIILKWSQTVDTSSYIYEIDARITMNMLSDNFGASHTTGNYYSSDWINFSSQGYSGFTNITKVLSADELDEQLIASFMTNYVNATGEKVPYKGYYVASIEIRIRNISGAAYSDYVVVKIDKEGVSNNASVQDEDGNTVDNDVYNDTNVVDPDSGYSSNTFSSGIFEIITLIKSGFGLLGNDGLLAMFRSLFDFMPGTYWTVYLTTFSIIMLASVLCWLIRSK